MIIQLKRDCTSCSYFFLNLRHAIKGYVYAKVAIPTAQLVNMDGGY